MSRVRLLELLGLHASATRDEVKSRYRELARKFHPDVNAGDAHAHARFRAIAAAYQELLADEADAGASPARAACTSPRVEVERPDDRDGDLASRTSTVPRSADGGLARRRTELRARLDQCKRTLHRLQADVRDGDAKALAARGRGRDQMARHFERRVEADRSRVYALFGEIAGIELELRGLEAGPGAADHEDRAACALSGSESELAEQVTREVQNMHDEELAALKRRYEATRKRR